MSEWNETIQAMFAKEAMADTPAPSTGLAERLANEIAETFPYQEGDTYGHVDCVKESAYLAVRRTIALAAGVVGEMAEEYDFPTAQVVLRETERRIKALLESTAPNLISHNDLGTKSPQEVTTPPHPDEGGVKAVARALREHPKFDAYRICELSDEDVRSIAIDAYRAGKG